jgi:hypothetical protein
MLIQIEQSFSKSQCFLSVVAPITIARPLNSKFVLKKAIASSQTLELVLEKA